jgi:hypothetical protein
VSSKKNTNKVFSYETNSRTKEKATKTKYKEGKT